ncbi:MAG: Holliday junction branch migration protein RuvA [Bacteroidia bacterium]|nr:Holliday junction branch migration protein RuvA [Bacteroidia bacterium]MCZ2248269.1 Holliday junction branch migration protein RuvA [Bacteroidia bacterium]
MLNHIEGLLVEKSPTHIVIDCNGLGFFLNISLNTYSKLPKSNEKVKLLTHISTNQNDFSQTAFGFIDESERNIFTQLISVSGVGPGAARMFLSTYDPLELTQHIINENVAALKSVKGIGEKTAQRIIVDLRGKFGKTDLHPNFSTLSNNKTKEEALSALVMLGFVKNVAEKVVDKSISQLGNNASVEDIIKNSLKSL